MGCAPALRGFEKLPGGWMMVAMDRLSDDFETLSHRISSLPGSVFDDMLAKLEKFHAAGYVHGDLRDVNIMVSKSDEKRFMIMNFDWAGHKGEARYPDLVSHKGIKRPVDAQFRKEILADHDLFMLDYITRTRSNPGIAPTKACILVEMAVENEKRVGAHASFISIDLVLIIDNAMEESTVEKWVKQRPSSLLQALRSTFPSSQNLAPKRSLSLTLGQAILECVPSRISILRLG
ncbi:hypothetical protein J3R82DRAFT_12027 [Butyriboletus roseoflavus]|nr:hypothetical protein J3R82DRAFT_12027 [Butyriboletus roseoflavus]